MSRANKLTTQLVAWIGNSVHPYSIFQTSAELAQNPTSQSDLFDKILVFPNILENVLDYCITVAQPYIAQHLIPYKDILHPISQYGTF